MEYHGEVEISLGTLLLIGLAFFAVGMAVGIVLW